MSEHAAARCINCQASENQAALLAVRHAGRDLWVCAQCMPVLIHEPGKIAGKLAAE